MKEEAPSESQGRGYKREGVARSHAADPCRRYLNLDTCDVGAVLEETPINGLKCR